MYVFYKIVIIIIILITILMIILITVITQYLNQITMTFHLQNIRLPYILIANKCTRSNKN